MNISQILITTCKRCVKPFPHGKLTLDMRGKSTRKYCDHCKILQHRDESKLYQRKKKLEM